MKVFLTALVTLSVIFITKASPAETDSSKVRGFGVNQNDFWMTSSCVLDFDVWPQKYTVGLIDQKEDRVSIRVLMEAYEMDDSDCSGPATVSMVTESRDITERCG